MKVKPLITGALRPNPIQIDDDNNDNINPIDTVVPRSVHNGKSYVQLDGTDAFLSGPNTFKPGTGDFTVAEWIKCPSNIHGGNVFHYGLCKSEGNLNNYMYMGFGRQAARFFPPPPVAAAYIAYIVIVVGGTTVVSHLHTSSDQTDLSNQWVHFALVCDRSDTTTAYLNGSAIPGSAANTMTTNNANLDLALQYGKVNVGTGDVLSAGFGVADARWYRKAFTADEITALYNESIIKRANAVSSDMKGRIGNMWTFGDTKGDVTSKLPAIFNDINQALDNDRNVVDNYSDQINNSRNSVGELVANGDFSSALDNSEWTVTTATGTGAWAVESGLCKTTLNLSVLNSVANNPVIGGLYSIKFDAVASTSGGTTSLFVYFGGVDTAYQKAQITNTSGSFEYICRAYTTTGLSFGAQISTGHSGFITVDNVSVTRIHHNALITHNVELDDLKKQDISNNPNRRLDG